MQNNTWERELENLNNDGAIDFYSAINFIRALLKKKEHEIKTQERQFILNILDGIDKADEQAGNKGGGTLAIRHALQSRVIE